MHRPSNLVQIVVRFRNERASLLPHPPTTHEQPWERKGMGGGGGRGHQLWSAGTSRQGAPRGGPQAFHSERPISTRSPAISTVIPPPSAQGDLWTDGAKSWAGPTLEERNGGQVPYPSLRLFSLLRNGLKGLLCLSPMTSGCSVFSSLASECRAVPTQAGEGQEN